MIGYITLGINDLAKAKAFYTATLAPLGYKPLAGDDRYQTFGPEGEPMGQFAITHPFNRQPATNGNGTMIALTADSAAAVDATHAAALAAGGADEGAPGPRDLPTFYGSYFRDPDGNKICVFTMLESD